MSFACRKLKNNLQFIGKFCPRTFDAFVFLPSTGASGGLAVIWKSSLPNGYVVFSNEFGISIEFHSNHDKSDWILINVYDPCTHEGNHNFLHWLKHVVMPDDVDWLIVGDFNLIRRPDNRNKPGGNINKMLLFNEVISSQGWVEISLHGRKDTWSNKQVSPKLERLVWFFTSSSLTLNYPGTTAHALNMEPSDHAPCLIHITTNIPKAKVFHFENYWMENEHFLEVVIHGWLVPTFQQDPAKIVTTKFKNLRVLRAWQAQISNLKANIDNVKTVLIFLGILEEHMDLSIEEWNFRSLLKKNTPLFCSNNKFIRNKEVISHGSNLVMGDLNYFMQMQQSGKEEI
jgi:hypothetical protein